MDGAGGDLSGETAEILMGTDHALDGQPEGCLCAFDGEGEGFEQFENAGAGVERHAGAAMNDVVAVEGADGDGDELRNFELTGEALQAGAVTVEDFFREIDQVHLVDGGDDDGDSEEAGDAGVAAGLGEDAFAGVDEDDGDVGGGGSGGHVARVLLVAGCVGNDEFSFGRWRSSDRQRRS